jgi:hypothetical protein
MKAKQLPSWSTDATHVWKFIDDMFKGTKQGRRKQKQEEVVEVVGCEAGPTEREAKKCSFGRVLSWENAHLIKKNKYVIKMQQNMAVHKKMSLRKASEAKKYQVASDLL